MKKTLFILIGFLGILNSKTSFSQTCGVLLQFDSANNRMQFFAVDSNYSHNYFFILDQVTLLTNLTGGKSTSYTFDANDTILHTMCLKIVNANTQQIYCNECIEFASPNSNLILPACTFNYSFLDGIMSIAVSDSTNNNATNWQINNSTFSGNSLNVPINTYDSLITVSINAINTIYTTQCNDSITISNPYYISLGPCNLDFETINIGMETYFIDISSNVNSGQTNYHWDFGDGSTSEIQNTFHQYTQEGNYEVCLNVFNTINPQCQTSICKNITVSSQIDTVLNCSAYFIKTQSSPYIISIINLSTGTNINFNWNFGNGSNSIFNSPTPTYIYAETGNYFVCLDVSGTNCFSSYCDSLKLDSYGYMRLQSGFSVNVFFLNEFLTSIKKNSIAKYKVFPNPTTNELWVENFSPLELSLYDLSGRLVAFYPMAMQRKINISNLEKGIYILKDQQGITHKINKN